MIHSFRKHEIENSLGEFSMLLTPTQEKEEKNGKSGNKLENIRSLAFDLFTGISSIIEFVNRDEETN